jgi:ferrochelatase
MVPISFVSDHIETLYEMDVTYKEEALRLGFENYFRVRLPNGDPVLAECLADVLCQHGF